MMGRWAVLSILASLVVVAGWGILAYLVLEEGREIARGDSFQFLFFAPTTTTRTTRTIVVDNNETSLTTEHTINDTITQNTTTTTTPIEYDNITLHILTYKRARSLRRLISSARNADYTLPSARKTIVNIHVCVDRIRATHGVDNETLMTLEEERARWILGDFTVEVWPQNVGLTEQWVNCWKAERQTTGESPSRDVHIILEDDLELSKYYHLWFVEAHDHFRNDTKVGSITGSRPWIQAKGDSFMEHVLARYEARKRVNLTVIKYRLMSPWSLSPKVEEWADFRAFYNWNKYNPRYNPRLPGVKLDHWYQTARREAIEQNKPCAMWEMHLVVFMQMRRSYTVYPWVFEDGQPRTVAGNHLESGLHYSPDRFAGVASSSSASAAVLHNLTTMTSNDTTTTTLVEETQSSSSSPPDPTTRVDTPLLTKPFRPDFTGVPCLGWDGEEEACVHPGWHWKLTYETDEELAEELALKRAAREKERARLERARSKGRGE